MSEDRRWMLEMRHWITTQNSVKSTDKPGVYMEILDEELHNRKLTVPIMTMEEAVEFLTKL